MRTEKVECDGCGNDLTVRTNSVDYRLVLASESKPGYGPGAYTDMMIYPPVGRAHHFCGLGCLDHWSDRRRHRDKLSHDWWEKWKTEHGTEHKNRLGGSTWSYPSPPDGDREARNREFDEAALDAFPMEHPGQKRRPAA